MTSTLQNFLDFVTLTHDVRAVKRSMWVKDEEQFENDAEHAFQLALTCLYVIEENKLELDAFRSMGLALVHDILEVHAGDTPVFAAPEQLASKQVREQEAVAALRRQWSQMPLLHELIEEYETRQTAESTLVYALDKLLPIANNYLDSGRNWKHGKVSLEQIIAVKSGKVDVDPTIARYYAELIELIRDRPNLFEVR